MPISFQLLIAAALAAASIQAGASAPREIAFDDGSSDASTVIGLFVDNGQQFHQRVDFTVAQVDSMSSVRVRLHAHVGSKIEPAPGEKSCRVGVRVNAGPWHWRDLDSYKNDSNQWIDFPLPASEWRAGINTVETNSTVGSRGNMTPQSLDILGSRQGPIFPRSWHTYDLKTYKLLADRNWGIRLSYTDSSVYNGQAVSLSILPANPAMVVEEPMQFSVEARDADGRAADATGVQYSASSGTIDAYGMFLADVDKPVVVTAKLGSFTAQAKCSVELKVPEGIAPYGSGERLRPHIPSSDLDLCGTWQFRKDTADVGESARWFADTSDDNWGTIGVPGCWQASGWGMDYHGVGWYKRDFDLPERWSGKQVWAQFGGVATSARVWINGQLVGEHTGDWAPFELRISDAMRLGRNTIVVRVQELPGHFSVGFACIVAPHFGGIWQAVSLHPSAGMHLDDVAALPSLASKDVLVEATVAGGGGQGSLVCVVTDPDGKEVARTEQAITSKTTADTIGMTLPIPAPKPWSPESPLLYTARVEVRQDGEVSDARTVRFGIRDVTRQGARLLLNGKPLFVRGVLHWGNYSRLLSIDPSEEQIRKEFSDIRAAGFNCVKVCMFTFPRRFYEIADETGMLIWQEYPIWLTFPKSDDNAPHDDMVAEYTEWFKFDRSHPSVILRDLTCEAQDANPTLAGRIFGIGKELTRNQLIEDNSAYMNQLYTDWFDAHIYAELDTLHGYLPSLVESLRSKPEIKPYLTGEDFDADTYRDMPAITKALASGRLPQWVDDGNLALQKSAEEEFSREYSPSMPAELLRRQNLHSIALRKGLAEEFRKHPELSGYVMTQIRDNVLTRPGFYDDLDRPKWTPKQWREFTGDRVLIADCERQSFCFRSGETPSMKLLLSNFGDALVETRLRWKLLDGKNVIDSGEAVVNAAAGTVSEVAECKLAHAGALASEHPVSLRLVAELGSVVSNEWPVWFFPELKKSNTGPCVYSASGLAADLPGFKVENVDPGKADHFPTAGSVIVTDTMDAATRKALAAGARVVFIPDDADASIPRRDAPFWRELAIWLPTGHAALGDFPHEDFVDRQFYDLTQRKPFDAGAYRDELIPLVWGVNTRFMGLMLVDYVFEARVGKGSLLACCLKVRGKDNVAGQYLLDRLVRYAASDAFKPAGSGDGELAKALR